MKVSMNIYGEQARTLARELGLECSNKTATVPMVAHFTYRDVEGRTVVAAEFTGEFREVDPEAAYEKAKQIERRFDVSRELRGY